MSKKRIINGIKYWRMRQPKLNIGSNVDRNYFIAFLDLLDEHFNGKQMNIEATPEDAADIFKSAVHEKNG